MLRTKKPRTVKKSDYKMDIREYLLGYSAKWRIPKESVIERFLMDYMGFEKRRQSLAYTVDDLANSYEIARKSYELRGREEDVKLRELEDQLTKATAELEYVIQRIIRCCGKAVELINLLPDADTKAIFELHYIEGLTLEEIRKSNRLYYGRTKINSLHREGLKQLHEILDL